MDQCHFENTFISIMYTFNSGNSQNRVRQRQVSSSKAEAFN